MLEAITEDGMLTWRCVVLDPIDEEVVSCGELKQCHISEARYLEPPGASVPGRGAIIRLPRCQCGAQTDLKADYRLKELWKETLTVVNEQGEVWAYALPLRYGRNLRAHQMLYERGQTGEPPVVSMPPANLLARPEVAQIGSPETVEALWFGFAVVAAYSERRRLKGSVLPVLPRAATSLFLRESSTGG